MNTVFNPVTVSNSNVRYSVIYMLILSLFFGRNLVLSKVNNVGLRQDMMPVKNWLALIPSSSASLKITQLHCQVFHHFRLGNNPAEGGGGGALPIMDYTGRLRPKGVPFS